MKPIIVRPLIDHINENMTLLENEYLCEPCNGWGRVMNEDGELRTIYVQCPRCLGEGKLDWIENVVGRSKDTRMVEPGVYVQETDFSTYIPSTKKEKKMADFDKAFEVTMGHEGGYSHDPDDPGGETYKGVARDRHPTWKGWIVIDGKKSQPNFPKNLDGDDDLQDCIKDFYKLKFWDPLCGDIIPDDDIAIEMFDTGVNMGTYQASKFLQQTLNLLNREGHLYSDIVEDGDVGKNTIKSLNTLLSYDPPELVLLWLNIFQGARYASITGNNPRLEKYMRGWSKRLKVVKQYG